MHSNRRLAAVLVLALTVLAPLAALAADATPRGVVNVNTASAEQLQLLPRIGPAVAQRIVDHRQDNGKFTSLEDLMLVRGIGESTFAQLEPFVTLSGDTTLDEKVRVPKRAADAADEGR